MTPSGAQERPVVAAERAPGDILLVSTADWDHPFWTNKQHVAVELARSGRRVLYVDSLGLRPPRLERRDISRIVRRVGQALRPARQVRPGLWVWSPLVLPWQHVAVVRRVNRVALMVGLWLARGRSGLQPTVLWTYSPLTLALLDLRPYRRVVYHAVDDIAAQPGMPAETIREGEVELARRADIVFTTAPTLQRRLTEAGARRCLLTPNVADADHFGAAMTQPAALDVAALPTPRIGFVGAISRYKLDFELIRAVAVARPSYSFVLIGQVGEGEPEAGAVRLQGVANLHLLGPRAYAELPACLAAMDVATLPAATNDYTEAMFPMKFFEYLAAGRPVVTTRLPALAAYEHLALVAPPEPAGFAEAIDRALAGHGPPLDARLAAARVHTYAARTRDMLGELDALG